MRLVRSTIPLGYRTRNKLGRNINLLEQSQHQAVGAGPATAAIHVMPNQGAMRKGTAPVHAASEGRDEHPARLDLIILRDRMGDGIKSAVLPLISFTVLNPFNGLFRVKRNQPGKA